MYSFLQNKEARTYHKLFKIIIDHIDPPISINCDFEKAIHKAAKKAFGNNLNIYGCFFHLCQNWLKHVKKLGLTKLYTTNKDFLTIFKLFQSLAYCKIEDVINGFDNILNSDIYYRLQENSSFLLVNSFTEYLRIDYISKNASFHISSWNIHDRILNKLPATNNPVESWHAVTTV